MLPLFGCVTELCTLVICLVLQLFVHDRVMYLGDLLGKYLLRDVTGAADDCVDPD